MLWPRSSMVRGFLRPSLPHMATSLPLQTCLWSQACLDCPCMNDKYNASQGSFGNSSSAPQHSACTCLWERPWHLFIPPFSSAETSSWRYCCYMPAWLTPARYSCSLWQPLGCEPWCLRLLDHCGYWSCIWAEHLHASLWSLFVRGYTDVGLCIQRPIWMPPTVIWPPQCHWLNQNDLQEGKGCATQSWVGVGGLGQSEQSYLESANLHLL